MVDTNNNHIVPVISVPKQAWTDEPRTPRRRSIIREFALNTSTHGLPGIARSQSKHNCIFWTVSFLGFTAIMTYFVTQSITTYFSFPTQTSVSIHVERSQLFPAVTFCNYSPVRYDKLIGPFLNYTNSLNITNTNDTTTFTAQQAYALRDYLQYRLNSNQSVSEYFFSLGTMLIECTFNLETCTSKDFTSFLSSTYGQCYTFNAKQKMGNGSELHYTNDNGGPGKLILRLYAHSHLYVPYISEDVSVGMVAMIHDNTRLPLIDVAGISLATGRKHKLGYKKKFNQFLSSPYTDCTTKIPVDMQSMFDEYGGADYAYSQGVCYTLCAQTYIYEQCGCVSPYQWSARWILVADTNIPTQAPLCNFTNSCYSTAALKVTKTSSIWDQYCSDCRQECSTVSFSITTSSVAAPSTLYAYNTKGFVESLSIPLPSNWSTNWLSEVQNNYVSLEVVCESIQVENYTQEASVSPVDLLSNVGGQTGLWIGISFLSIMEFIEMVYRIVRYDCHIILQILKTRLNHNRI